MKHATFFLAPAVLALTLGARAVDVDGIAAVVGDATILKSDVQSEMYRFGSNLAGEDFKTVLSRLIDRKLILKAAANSKMTMQEWVVDNRVREIVDTNFGGDRNQLIAALAKEKLPFTEFRQKIKDDLIVGAMRWNVVDKFVSASPAEMRKEYDEHPERYSAAARTTVSVILLHPEDAEHIGEIAEALKTEPFADVARRWSQDPRAKDGGQWKDVVPAEVFRPEICDAIAALPKGTFSDWIDLDGWKFLLRKDDETGAVRRSFAEAYDDIEENIRRRRAKELYDRWLDILKAETYIKVFD